MGIRVNNLELPQELCDMVDSGLWPSAEADRQEADPLLGEKAAHSLSLTDSKIILMPTPFHAIAVEVDGGNDFWTRQLTNVGEINYDKAIIIADFGLGSDSAIILYYGDTPAPVVMYLKWSGNGNEIRHSWVQTHSSFGEFARDVNLMDCIAVPRDIDPTSSISRSRKRQPQLDEMQVKNARKHAIRGAGVGVMLSIIAIVLAGGGHGTSIPSVLFFAPLAVVYMLPAYLLETLFGAVILGGAPLLYASYAILLNWGNRRGKGANVLLVLTIFHFGAAGAVVFVSPEAWDVEGLKKAFHYAPIFTIVGFAMFAFVLLMATYFALKIRVIADGVRLCNNCAYNLTGNISGTCHECGEPI